jgi:iron complex transport system ATP-binding protein
MTPVLEATGLALGDRLKPTSLALAGGELACLAGPNGSGKTSLLHAIAGIGRPSGKVLVGGIDPHDLPAGQRQRLLSYLPAGRDVSWPLTVRDVVALGAAAGHDAEQIDELLARLDLSAFAGRRVDLMSTGERSRVLIARALLPRPKLLLLDEPAANLDPYWQLRMMADLRERSRRDGQAMLVAVHDLELARSFADRLLIMNEGSIVADGEPASLLASEAIPRIFRIEWTETGWQPVDGIKPTPGID